MAIATDRIDSINIILMLISVVLSLVFPFELFLFSYIILGPLHYMTELSWLKDRDFFAPDALGWKMILGVALLGIGLLVVSDISASGGLIAEDTNHIYRGIFIACLFGGLMLSGIIQQTTDLFNRVLLGIAVIGLGVAGAGQLWFLIIIGLFLPTLIHTTIFTGGFMLEGALKNGRRIGYLAFLVFLFCHVLIFLFPSVRIAALESTLTSRLYTAGEFQYLNQYLFQWFVPGDAAFVLDSTIGLRIQSFIAFAYTYHYLNWFSKTEVIRWHRIPRQWLTLSIMVWIASIGLHLVDMKTGIIFISLLSLLHVFMEFPLNYRSFMNLFRMLKKRSVV